MTDHVNGPTVVQSPDTVDAAPEVTAVETITPPPARALRGGNPAVVGTLTREEYLEIENLSLKTQNMALQEQRLQQDLIKSNQMRQELQRELDDKRITLSAKYGCDMLAKTTQITADGVIIDQTRASQPQVPPGRGPIPASANGGRS